MASLTGHIAFSDSKRGGEQNEDRINERNAKVGAKSQASEGQSKAETARAN